MTGVSSRVAAVLLGATTILSLAGGGEDGPNVMFTIAALSGFTLGWVAMGIQAIRLDRPATMARPV